MYAPSEGCFSDVTRPRDASATSHLTNATRRDHFSSIFIIIFQEKINKNYKKSFENHFRSILFPPEGNFDIDAGDGGWGGTI